MSIIVQVHDDGVETHYFRVVEQDGEYFAERPDKYSVKLEVEKTDTYSLVLNALETMRRKDEEWKALNSRNT